MAQNLRVLITGGAGFIGSCFVRASSGMERFSRIVNVDKLTYAGNLENVLSVAADPRYVFVRADITDDQAMDRVFAAEKPELVVHFAAESHVDRSILSPTAAIDTNVRGTFTLLEAARRHQYRRDLSTSPPTRYTATWRYPMKPMRNTRCGPAALIRHRRLARIFWPCPTTAPGG